MGLLSGILTGLAPDLTGLTNFFGSNSFNSTAQWGLKPGDNVGGNFGHSLNLWTGQADSARQQYQYNLALQKNAQQFAKWQMGNSHQMEVKDLKNAGLNPVLSSGGTGADAGGVAPSTTGAGTGGHDPFAMVMNAIGAINSAKMTEAQVKNLDTQSALNEETGAKTHTEKEILDIQKNYIAPMEESIIALNTANTGLAKQNTLKAFEETIKTNAEAFAQKLLNEGHKMDIAKRKNFYADEVKLYMAELKRGIASAGLEGSKVYQAIDHAFNTAGKVFHANLGYNFSNANVNSNANVKSQSINATIGMFR